MAHRILWLAIALFLPQSNLYPPQYQVRPAATAGELPPAWTTTVPSEVGDLAIAPDGSCVAIVARHEGGGRIAMVDARGQRSWEAPTPPPTGGSPVAVAPGCAWVAFDSSRESDRRPAAGGGYVIDRGRVAVVRQDGTTREVLVDGQASSIAVSPAGDLIAIGSDCVAERNSITLASPDGRVVLAVPRHSYRGPELAFSRDGQFIIVQGWFGVGVMTRDGRAVWGPSRGENDDARRRTWRRIDASRDLRWFAAQYGPMHGMNGGSYALLSAAGEVTWEGPPVWGADARIAPDGSFMAVVGREIRNGDADDDVTPKTVALIDRTGRTLASKTLRRPSLEGVSADGRFVLTRELDAERAGQSSLVGRDRALAPVWRIGGAERYAVNLETGLVVAWRGGQVRGYIVPR